MSLTVREFYLNTEYIYVYIKKKRVKKEIRVAVNFKHCTNKAFNFSVEIVLLMLY